MALTKFEISCRRTEIKDRLDDVLLSVPWRELAKDYFNKPASWIYARLNGMDDDGNEVDFTDAEKARLREALKNLSRRIDEAADRIC